MGKNILCFLLKGRFIFRAFKTGKWQALTLFFNRLLAALWRMYYSRAGNKISETGKLLGEFDRDDGDLVGGEQK